MDMKNEKLQEYAKLLIEVGLHVQKGQTLVISSPVECAYFARLCATAAYDVGCREVVMNWHDDYLAREKFLRAEDAVFDQVPQWRQHFLTTTQTRGRHIWPLTLRTRSISRGWIRTAGCAPCG